MQWTRHAHEIQWLFSSPSQHEIWLCAWWDYWNDNDFCTLPWHEESLSCERKANSRFELKLLRWQVSSCDTESQYRKIQRIRTVRLDCWRIWKYPSNSSSPDPTDRVRSDWTWSSLRRTNRTHQSQPRLHNYSNDSTKLALDLKESRKSLRVSISRATMP